MYLPHSFYNKSLGAIDDFQIARFVAPFTSNTSKHSYIWACFYSYLSIRNFCAKVRLPRMFIWKLFCDKIDRKKCKVSHWSNFKRKIFGTSYVYSLARHSGFGRFSLSCLTFIQMEQSQVNKAKPVVFLLIYCYLDDERHFTLTLFLDQEYPFNIY